MAKVETLIQKMEEFILSLPDTKIQMSWGKPHYMVGKRVFLGFGEEGGKPNVITFGLEPEHMDLLLETDARFEPSRYKGGIQIEAKKVKSWAELKKLVLGSYRLRATKKQLAMLDAKKKR